jgi:uncharacterized protein (DUF362 family)
MGQVVLVRDPALVDSRGAVRREAVLGWLTRALEALTGERGPKAWAALFSPSDRVAIKVNAMGGPRAATSPAVALAIADGARQAGVPPRDILIWDRSSAELRRAGYEVRQEGDGPRCFGTDLMGYEPQPSVHATVGSCFSRILTRWATALVDVPVLKDHDLSGVSLSMKNLFGLIHNPNKYHDEGCSPYLADLLGHPEVRGRWRLAVCDAHRGQCHGGPAAAPRWTWPYGGLLVATDAVALDRVGEGILEARRREIGLPSLEEERRPAVHIQAAHDRGLGEGRAALIRLRQLG